MEVCMRGNLETSVKAWPLPRMQASAEDNQPRSDIRPADPAISLGHIYPSFYLSNSPSLLLRLHASIGAPSAQSG